MEESVWSEFVKGILSIMESSLNELSKYRLRECADYKDFEIISKVPAGVAGGCTGRCK